MMAAASGDKVRLLLSRGASTTGALTIAASYRGTADSVRALVDAGAAVNPPAAQRVRNTPLVFASMSGDLENVKLLLAHGADPSVGSQTNLPLGAAITFGHPDVVQALITAGASTGIRESTGINLLHWAAITNRPGVIPLLAAAKVPLDALDDYGYTPLMYAATIDFGDTAVLNALLKAGADRKVKNDEGRTALEQARYYHHTLLEAALR
jgi:ankyrin repeat protein